MQKDLDRNNRLYQVSTSQKGTRVNSGALSYGRYLLGRVESCDIIIHSTAVSAIHAILEITPQSIRLYDMNSRNGTFVGGKKIVVTDIKVGETITLGTAEIDFSIYDEEVSLPPVLGSLRAKKGSASTLREKAKKPSLPLGKPQALQENLSNENSLAEENIPYIIYPLGSDPKSDYCEYIFEDSTQMYPIFKYEINKQSVEVIILFRDKVYSVDYLPEKDGVYQMSGFSHASEEIEFPYLGKTEKLPFIEIHKGNCVVRQLHQYTMLHLINGEIVKVEGDTVNIQGEDIVKLSNLSVEGTGGYDLEIYIRRVNSPPKVKGAPFFGRDSNLKKYVFFVVLFILFPLLALNMYEVDEKLKDEKDLERIATILYKQKMNVNKNRTVETTKKKPVKKQKAPKKQVLKKETPKKTQSTSQKSPEKTVKKTLKPGAKKAKKVQRVKRVKNPTLKSKSTSRVPRTRSSNAAKTKTVKTRRANIKNNSKGRVDVYKSFDFKSSVSSLMAKGGRLKGSKTLQAGPESLSSAQVSGGVATNIKKASVGADMGSLSGSIDGKLGESKGTKGLSTKKGVYTAGIPSETVVLGSMDPDVIRRILRDNIPFFRSCYQEELNSSNQPPVSGTIRLVFTIGASGHVARSGVDGRTKLPAKVKRCVVGVLNGIKFPRPMGGGTVDVKQPFNFHPRIL